MKTADWVWSLMFRDWRSCVVINYNYAFMHEGTDENNKRKTNYTWCWLQWSRGLGRWPAAAQLLGFRVRIPTGTWMSVSCVCVCVCVWCFVSFGWSLVRRSRIEWGVAECDKEVSIMRRPWPLGVVAPWNFTGNLSTTPRVSSVITLLPTHTHVFFCKSSGFLNSVAFK